MIGLDLEFMPVKDNNWVEPFVKTGKNISIMEPLIVLSKGFVEYFKLK
jgi:hypothetical protein